jgi:hypothetical protein
LGVESELRAFNSQSEFEVQRAFGRVYSKMLEIGTTPKELSPDFFLDEPLDHDSEEVRKCRKIPGFALY